MTQSDDLPSRVSRSEDDIIDLKLAVSATLQAIDKNSDDIAQLIEVSRRNSEGISVLLEISRRQSDQIASQSSQIASQNARVRATEEAAQDIRNTQTSINAAIERMDRILDYIMRRDSERSQE